MAPAPEAPPLTAGWASAVGNQRVARMAAEYAEDAEADESSALLEDLDEALAIVEDEPAAGEDGAATEGVAMLRRSYLARQPTKVKARTKAPRVAPLTADDIVDLKRVGTRTLKALDQLEQERAMTSAEVEQLKERIQGLMERAKAGSGDRSKLTASLNGMRALPGWARKRAAALSSTKGKKLISSFKLEPPVIRVGEHEAARISFVVNGAPTHVGAYILEDPEREGTSYKFFNMDAKAGLHQLIWDGTFEGKRNRPPEPGVYRIEISVTGDDGKSETIHEMIRVENPDAETVLPRVGSGLAISALHFDGKTFTLTDADGHSIEASATSGLKPSNPRNPDKKDYTDPKYQWTAGRGPIPEGPYSVSPGQFQLPDADKAGKKYVSGGTAAHWGPMRIQILPNKVKNRSEFFLHMDVANDGTAGCIGFPTTEAARFNQIMSLIATSKNDIKLVVAY